MIAIERLQHTCVRIRAWTALSLVLVVCDACIGTRTIEMTGACSAPEFEVRGDQVDPDGRGWAVVLVSRKDVNVSKLTCLATQLGREHPAWTEVRVGIFDARDAADNYRFDWQLLDTNFPRRREVMYEQQKRATYVLNRATHMEYLALRVFAMTEDTFETRIDLPVKGMPQCRFEIAGRCVVAVDWPDLSHLPFDLESGEVTLAADVGKDGRMVNVRATVIASQPERNKDALAATAIENLETWQIEPASRTDATTIRYTFVTQHLSAAESRAGNVAERELDVDAKMESSTRVIVRRLVDP